MQPKPKTEEKLLDIDVKVKKKPTGFLSVGGGYSSVDKFLATADITQANLFGTGRLIKLKGEFGGRSTSYELGYRDPGFLTKNSYSEPMSIIQQESIPHLTEKRWDLICCWVKACRNTGKQM